MNTPVYYSPHALPNDYIEFDKKYVETTIIDRFQWISATYPDLTAVRSPDGELNYRALSHSSAEVAAALLQRFGTGSEPIALFFKHGVEAVVAQLGVVRAGKFYAFIDHTLPRPQQLRILRDLEPRAIVCSAELEKLAFFAARELANIPVISFSACRNALFDSSRVSVSADDVALVVFSSGSTGEPKGVVVSHRNVMHFTMNHTNTTHISHWDRATQVCSLHGASNIGEVFPILLNGATLLPFSLKDRGMQELLAWMGRQKSTLCTFVPAVFRLLVESVKDSSDIANIRLVRLSGDRILNSDVSLFRSVFPPCSLFRGAFGASEAMLCAQLIVDHSYQAEDELFPAGFPLHDMEISIVDDDRNTLPFHQIGEIAVTSEYLSLGYWRKPPLTAQRFFPSSVDPKKRTYLTRDLGYLREDGCLVFVGRKDASVKVCGRLVELHDVEAALLALPNIRDAVVVPADAGIDTLLVAYLTIEGKTTVAESTLRALLKERLPGEAIPKKFIVLRELPITRENKIDRYLLRRDAQTIVHSTRGRSSR